MFKKIYALFLSIILILISFIPAYATDASATSIPNTDKKTVRVGWFDSEGVHPTVENGNYIGYDYDYLQALSQYNNWQYEYFEGTWEECYNKLANGEIDLIGVINKTPEREKLFDYSYVSIGNELCCLFVLPNNMNYSYQNFEEFDGMTVAIEKGTYQSTMLSQYASSNDFSYTTKEFANLKLACDAVKKGEVDAVLASNTDIISGFKTIAQFNPIPFYYATTKGNTEILQELNTSINELYTYFPNFGSELYSKYYGTNDSAYTVFTDAELEFIKSNPEIIVAYDPIWFPIEYSNDGQCAGIVFDILEEISKKSGLVFTYDEGSSSVNVLKEFQEGRDNFITSIAYDYSWAAKNNVNITQPFLDASIMRVTKKSSISPKTVALVEVDYITEMVKRYMPGLEPKYYGSMSDCIHAVYTGAADCTYLNNYEAEYYMTVSKYRSMHFHTIDTFRQKLCLGIATGADPRLFSIVSKCLKAIPDSERNTILYNNSYHTAPVSLDSFIRTNPMVSLGIVIGFVIFLAFIAALFIRGRLQNSRRMAIENERYNQLAEMVGEHIFEYNYATDVLSFNSIQNDLFWGQSKVDHFSKVAAAIAANSPNPDEETLLSCLTEHTDSVQVLNLRQTDNTYCHYNITTKIIHDNNNQPVYAIGKLQNIQDSYEEKLELIDKSMRDSATGLYNSMTYKKLASESFAANGGVLFAFDIDHFKNINDTFGHLSGDKTIIAVSRILQNAVSTFNAINPLLKGIVGRVGGDEFAIFLPGLTSRQSAIEFCESIHKEIAFLSETDETLPEFTISIGATFALSDEDFTDCYKRADQVLYVVKDRGRNGFEIL